MRYYWFFLAVSLLYCGCRNNGQVSKKAVDVLIIGGTTSGTAAGISAAREGVHTLIVEETPWLGGMFTSQGVGAADGNHHLPSGIWNEFREKLRAHYGGPSTLATGWVSNTLFEPHIGDSVFKAMASKEEKLEVIHGFHLIAIIKERDLVKGAVFMDEKGHLLRVAAKVVIDATDIGESLKMAGAAYRLGMDACAETGEPNAPEKANGFVQDLTWVAILKDYGQGADKTIPRPENYDPADFEGCCDRTVDNRIIDCDQMLTYGRMPNNKYMINWPRAGNDIYLNVIEMPREARIKELQKAKDVTLQFVYYIQHELGYRHLGLADDEFETADLLAYAPYHREGRRLKGISFLTYNHVADPYGTQEALYRTGISVGDYPVDHHHDKNPDAPQMVFPPVPSFNVPLGSLIPERVDGLIVSDKSISVSNLINGSTRLQPVVLLTGQAAGMLAALAVKENKQPREVPVRKVQQTLLNSNAYIMPLFDVPPSDPDFLAFQKVTATGILKTAGESYQWANRTWAYPEQGISEKEFAEGLKLVAPAIKMAETGQNLTERKAREYLSLATGKEIPEHDITEKAITRRKLVQLIDKYLDPFSLEIDFNGNYKQNERH